MGNYSALELGWQKGGTTGAHLSCFLVARKPPSALKRGGAHRKGGDACPLICQRGIVQRRFGNAYSPRPSSVQSGAIGDEIVS